MHFHRVLVSAAVLFSGAAQAYVGQWRSYTNQDRVTCLAAHQGMLYAGTIGGIRRIDPETLAEKSFTNLDGLLDCWITGIAETGDGALWAVSRSGTLGLRIGDRWETHGRSFASARWNMNERAVLAVGSYLFLGSEKGLALFDTRRKVSQANLTRFGDQIDISVLSLLRRKDTLYIGTSEGVYKAGVNFMDPLNPGSRYGNLQDPRQWIRVIFPPDTGNAKRQFDYLMFVGDSLATFGPGTILGGKVPVQALLDNPVQINGKKYDSSMNWFSSALLHQGNVYSGGLWALFYSPDPTAVSPSFRQLPAPRKFPFEGIAGLAALGGTVWAQSVFEMHRLDDFSRGFRPVPSPVAPSTEVMTRSLKNVVLDRNGDAYIGSWGGGLVRIRSGNTRVWNRDSDPCLREVLENFPVTQAVSNIRGQHLFFSNFFSEDVNQLVHLNISTGKASCLDSQVVGAFAHSVRIFSDSLLGVGTELGVNFYKFREGVGEPVLTSLGLWNLEGQANEVWDLTEDATGRPWALIGDRLAFADSVDHPNRSGEKRFKPVEGFPGRECKALERDPRDLFWVGCGNGLFNVEPAPEGLGKLQRLGLDDGLLSLGIRDIAVDPANGQVWISTDRGVSMLESRSQPPVVALKAVRAYPNPFRPHHRQVVFDRLPLNSMVRLHNSAGDVVRILRPSELAGNQAQWDGKNQDGKPVAPGVYLYSVVSGISVERGKIIVAR